MDCNDVINFARVFHERVMEAFGDAARDGVTRIVGRRAEEIRIDLTIKDGGPGSVALQWGEFRGGGANLREALAEFRKAWEASQAPGGVLPGEMVVDLDGPVRVLRMPSGGYRIFSHANPVVNFGRYPTFADALRWASLNGWQVVGDPEDGRTEVVEFVGIQEGVSGRWAELWNLVCQVVLAKPNGKTTLIRGATVGRDELEEAGIRVPVLFQPAE